MSIDILFKVLATEWLSLVFCESVMADHLLGPQNWQAVLPLSRYLRGFYWLPLQTPSYQCCPMAWLTLVMPSEAGKVSHKVHSIISSAGEFNSACSEVLLIAVCGLMWSWEVFVEAWCYTFQVFVSWRQESFWTYRFCVERKVSFSYLMNRCLHNTAHPTDGGVISSHYGGLQEGRDLCGRTERLTSSPPDRAHGGPLTRVVLPEKPKVGFPFHEVSSWCAGNPETCVKGSGCQGPLSGHSGIWTKSRKVQWLEQKAFVLFRRFLYEEV